MCVAGAVRRRDAVVFGWRHPALAGAPRFSDSVGGFACCSFFQFRGRHGYSGNLFLKLHLTFNSTAELNRRDKRWKNDGEENSATVMAGIDSTPDSSHSFCVAETVTTETSKQKTTVELTLRGEPPVLDRIKFAEANRQPSESGKLQDRKLPKAVGIILTMFRVQQSLALFRVHSRAYQQKL